MRWVAPTEKDDANHQLEKRLWDAADQFRANSGLKAGQYSTPVLGLIVYESYMGDGKSSYTEAA
jgi:type I restriction enzyme M protein